MTGRRYGAAAAGLVVRAVAIGAIGLFLGSFDSGLAVILAYYAVLFVLAIPLLPLRAAPLMTIGLAVACLVPVLSHLLRADARLPFGGRNPTFATLLEAPGDFPAALLLTGYYPALAWTAYLCAGLAAGRLPLRERRTAGWLLGRRRCPRGRGVGGFLDPARPVGWQGQDRCDARRPGCGLDASLELGLYGNTPTSTWWWLAVDAAHSSTPLDLLHTIGIALGLLGALLLLASAGRLCGRP